jgi:hypothetical protein
MEDTHRWYSCAATLGALAVVMEKRTSWRLGAAGILSGLASFFTQTQGMFAIMGMIAFMVWEWREGESSRQELLKKTACLLAAFVATVLATEAYFIWKADLGRFLDCVVRIPVLYLSADPANTWHVYMTEMPHLPHWYNLPGLGRFLFVYALLPLVYLLFPVRHRQEAAHGEEWRGLLLVNIMGLFLFASVALAPSNFRLCTVSPTAFVALIYWLRGDGKIHRIIAGSLWVAVFYLGVVNPLRVQVSSVNYLQLPRGRMAFPPQAATDYQMFQWLACRTRPGDPFLAAGQLGALFPLALRPVDEASGYDNGRATLPKWVESAVAALERYRVQFIEWPPDSIDPSFYRPEEDHLAPLREYVQRNYHLVKRFESLTGDEFEEIWERNP